jgi:hypothetical protein
LTSDAKFDIEDVKACASALNFIFSSSSKHNIDSETLSNELQQLGLPKGMNQFISLFKTQTNYQNWIRFRAQFSAL